MTLKQFIALLERYEEEARRWDFRAGVIASVIANVYRDRARSPFTPADFFATLKPQPRHERQQTWEEQLKIVEALNEAFGGRDLRKKDADSGSA